jgi:hypothetical protein
MSVTRRRVAALAALPTLALVAAGCGGDVREQTQEWRNPLDGVSGSAGDVDIRNAFVVTDGEGQATLFASFANRGRDADALTGIIIDGRTGEPGTGRVDIPGRGVISITPDTDRVDVSGVDLTPGLTVDVEFVFAEAPRATLTAVVQANEGLYASSFD